MREVFERFCEETARIERMFILAGALADGLPDDVAEFLRDEDWQTLEGCFGEIPQRVKDDVEAHDDEALPQWLQEAGKLGFVVQMATPVMTPRGNGASYSWGHYTTKWVYGETLETALDAGFAWVESQRSKEKAKAAGV